MIPCLGQLRAGCETGSAVGCVFAAAAAAACAWLPWPCMQLHRAPCRHLDCTSVFFKEYFQPGGVRFCCAVDAI